MKTPINDALDEINYDAWNLMGRDNRFIRQRLMLLITGDKLPISQCGVTAIQNELENRFPHRHLASCQALWPEALKTVLQQG